MSAHLTEYTVERVGLESHPVVIIENFSKTVSSLLDLALTAQFAETTDGSYPGVRAPLNPSYMFHRQGLLAHIFSNIFGFAKVGFEGANFSIVTRAPNQLTREQRAPHVDDVSPNILAFMHYLRGPDMGGTNFFRHRQTGFEAINHERSSHYQQVREAEQCERLDTNAGYLNGSDERFELTTGIEAQVDRFILYRGNVLHSGHIPESCQLVADPAVARLTINGFFVGQ